MPAAQSRPAAHVVGDRDAIAIGEGLLDRSLPVRAWTHEAHCIATVFLMRMHPDLDLSRQLPKLIRAYNEATGVPNSDTRGYHETITQFYIRAIAYGLARQPSGLGLGEACTRLIASPFGARDLPLTFYSRERLFSVEARRIWIAPDLRELDLEGIG
ncbi:MAG: hypothetical protein HXY30_06410 [Pseudorhodoplanes sp.]|nr:hypothetical protein [Pseudorhodoplanes sp.]